MVPSALQIAHGIRARAPYTSQRLTFQLGSERQHKASRKHRVQATAQAEESAVGLKEKPVVQHAAGQPLLDADATSGQGGQQQQQRAPAPPLPAILVPALPPDVLEEFEHKLEADIETVGATLFAVTGVIFFWRGVWSLLDYFVGDSVFGDVCCIMVGLVIILWIRLARIKVAQSLWPPS